MSTRPPKKGRTSGLERPRSAVSTSDTPRVSRVVHERPGSAVSTSDTPHGSRVVHDGQKKAHMGPPVRDSQYTSLWYLRETSKRILADMTPQYATSSMGPAST